MRAENGSGGDPDQAFIDMMHDFMERHRDIPASTESFKTVAEKHMTTKMDISTMEGWTGFSRVGLGHAGATVQF